ncbi:putative aminoacrylate hydrolase RutD [Bienertia sinuspersici]
MGELPNSNSGAKPPLQLIHDAMSIYYLHPFEGRNKFGFVNGDFKQHTDSTSPKFAAWKSNNSIICAWLFNSIDATIQPSVASNNTHEMWKDLQGILMKYATNVLAIPLASLEDAALLVMGALVEDVPPPAEVNTPGYST